MDNWYDLLLHLGVLFAKILKPLLESLNYQLYLIYIKFLTILICKLRQGLDLAFKLLKVFLEGASLSEQILQRGISIVLFKG